MSFAFKPPISPEMIECTREAFQPYSPEPLSDEDCRAIHRNVTGVLTTLLEIRRDLDRRREGAPLETDKLESVGGQRMK